MEEIRLINISGTFEYIEKNLKKIIIDDSLRYKHKKLKQYQDYMDHSNILLTLLVYELVKKELTEEEIIEKLDPLYALLNEKLIEFNTFILKIKNNQF